MDLGEEPLTNFEGFEDDEKEKKVGLLTGTKRYRAKKIVVQRYHMERDENGEKTWKKSKWPTFEGQQRKSTSILSFHALVQLRSCLAKGVLLLDVEADNFEKVFTILAQDIAVRFKANERKINAIMTALYKVNSMTVAKTMMGAAVTTLSMTSPSDIQGKKNSWLEISEEKPRMKKSEDFEVAQVFASALSELERAKFAMVRLLDPIWTPVSGPVRFLFILLGPENPQLDYSQLGRSMATLIMNHQFQEFAFKAVDRRDLLNAVDRFLDESVVVAPGDQEQDDEQLGSFRQIRNTLESKPTGTCKKSTREYFIPLPSGDEYGEFFKDQRHPLSRTGRLFGGMVDDLKERFPKYLSDFTDVFQFQSITSIFFIFFACFAPAITFGGLLGAYTNQSMGTTETLAAQCLCGIIWSLFAAQPLILLSLTGPVLIFEAALYTICELVGLNFLTVRLWTGVWIFLIIIITVAFDGSSLLRYVSRFTEEIFATLISAIFILESVKFLKKTLKTNPVNDLMRYWYKWEVCANTTNITIFDSHLDRYQRFWKRERGDLAHFAFLNDEDRLCFDHHQPDTALLTIILLFATFAVAYLLKKLRSSHFLGRTVRQAIGDFGLLISIGVVAFLEYGVFYSVFLERLHLNPTFGFVMSEKRGYSWFTPWAFPSERWYGYIVAVLPGFLVFLLLFVETVLTELIILKRGLTKGSGVHWDVLLTGILTLLCSIFGLPWMCAAAAQSLAHSSSLTVMKPCQPGDKPTVDHVIEQRVTGLFVSILLGVCSFVGIYLRFLPLAVLFGVFFYLGVMGLIGMQFMHRILLFLVPAKYFPNVLYCQKVKARKIHLFTFIQLISVGIVYAVKSFKATALIFPLVLLLTSVLRHKLLPLLFTYEELNSLDAEEDVDEDDAFCDMFAALKF